MWATTARFIYPSKKVVSRGRPGNGLSIGKQLGNQAQVPADLRLVRSTRAATAEEIDDGQQDECAQKGNQ
jgi:hypothetical protein